METIQEKFYRLHAAWIYETQILSSLSDILYNSNNLKIIGMGKEAIPFLLAQLKERSGMEFFALEMITEERPYPEGVDIAGRIDLHSKYWVEWGINNLYITKDGILQSDIITSDVISENKFYLVSNNTIGCIDFSLGEEESTS